MVPGFEGMVIRCKYLRRIKLVGKNYMTYNDYGHLASDYKSRRIESPDWAEIGHYLSFRGAAALRPRILRNHGLGVVGRGRDSKRGRIDGRRAELEACGARTPAYPMAHTRFALPLEVGRERVTLIMSRCTDELGTVNPPGPRSAKYWNEPMDASFRVPGADNSVLPWRVAGDGSVHNGLA